MSMMRTRAIACLILLLCAGGMGVPAVAAETMEPEWNMTYSLGLYTDFYAAVAAPDGGFLLGGLGGSETSNRTAVLMAIDGAGAEVWNRSYDGYAVADIALIPGGDSAVATYAFTVSGTAEAPVITGDSSLLRVDGEGAVIWQQPLENWRASGVAVAEDGSIVAAGWEWTDGAAVGGKIARFGADGTLEEMHSLGDGAPYALMNAPDGGFYLANGASPLAGAEDAGGSVVLFDATLDPVWETGFASAEAFCLAPADDGGCVAAGSISKPASGFGEDAIETTAWAVRLDSAGNEVWNRSLDGFAVYGAALSGNAGYALAGMWGDAPQVIFVAADGNDRGEWVQKDVRGRMSVAVDSPDGGFLVAGWSRIGGDVKGVVMAFPEEPAPEPTGSPGFGAASGMLAAAGILLYAARRR